MTERLQDYPEEEPLDALTEYALLYDECRDALRAASTPQGPAEARFGRLGSFCLAAGCARFDEHDYRQLTVMDLHSSRVGYRRILMVAGGIDDVVKERTAIIALTLKEHQLLQEDAYDEQKAQALADRLDGFRFALRETTFDAEQTAAALDTLQFERFIGSSEIVGP